MPFCLTVLLTMLLAPAGWFWTSVDAESQCMATIRAPSSVTSDQLEASYGVWVASSTTLACR